MLVLDFWKDLPASDVLALSSRNLQFATEYGWKSRTAVTGWGFSDWIWSSRRILVVELKSVERLEFVHKAQLLLYLRAAQLRAGLLFNFNATPLTIRRVVL